MKIVFLIFLLLFTASAIQAQQDRMARFNNFKWVNPPTEEDAWAEEAGILHKTFYSEANKADIGYFIRFPRGYDAPENRDQSYPVIYYLHAGTFGSERGSLLGFQSMLDFFNSDDYPNVFMVGINGGQYSHRDFREYQGHSAFMEFIDYMDETYRTLHSREKRALMGYSFGAAPVARHLLKYPELFKTGVALDGSYTRELNTEKNQGDLGRFQVANWRHNTYTNATEYAARENPPPIKLMVAIGDDSRNYPGTLHWVFHLTNLKIKHQLVVVPGIPHSGLGRGNGWQVENTGERIYRFVAEGLTEVSETQDRPAATRGGQTPRPTPTAFDPNYVMPWDIAGEYRAEGGGPTAKVSKVEGQWRFTGRNGIQQPVIWVSEKEFMVEGLPPVFRLELDSAEQVTAITVLVNEREFLLPRLTE